MLNIMVKNNIWNISICSDIMFNFPFTLNEYIFIPIDFIKKCFDSSDSNKLIKTLIHEKIHVGQRTLQNEWEIFIESFIPGWIKINENKNSYLFNVIKKIKQNDQYNFITNPDTWYDYYYIYKSNNNLYYGDFIYEKKIKNIKIIFFDITDSENIKQIDNLFEEEHPYEYTAYKLSDKISKIILDI